MVLGLYTEAAIPATYDAGAPGLTCAPAPAAKLVLVALLRQTQLDGCALPEFPVHSSCRRPGAGPTGNAFYQTPRLQALLAGSYQVPTPAGDLLLRADYAWQDKIQFNVINEFNCRGAYGTANDRIAPASRAQTWGARERTVA